MRQARRIRPYTPYSGVRHLLPAPRVPAGRSGGMAPADPEPVRAEAASARPETIRGVVMRPGDPCPRSDQGLGWGRCWRCDMYPQPEGCVPRAPANSPGRAGWK